MTTISVVVVTGASGFIGAHIVRVCLERGYTVHACVRNKNDPKNAFLTKMPGAVGAGAVRLFSADLLTMGSYDEAVAGADAVIHAAAQVDPTVITDPWKDMVEPSTKGALNVLGSVNKFRVRHYVHTSSIAAVGIARGRLVSEADWSTTPIEEAPYIFAKTAAEKLVWEETRGKPYTVSCINPSMVWGPCLAKPHAKASPFIFRQALYGNTQPNTMYSVVDVRDVATAHVEALVRPEADRKRFILDGDGDNVVMVNNLLQSCREMFPDFEFSDAPGEYVGPTPLPRRTTDNRLSKEVLGIEYTPLLNTIRDTVTSMTQSGWVPVRHARRARL